MADFPPEVLPGRSSSPDRPAWAESERADRESPQVVVDAGQRTPVSTPDTKSSEPEDPAIGQAERAIQRLSTPEGRVSVKQTTEVSATESVRNYNPRLVKLTPQEASEFRRLIDPFDREVEDVLLHRTIELQYAIRNRITDNDFKVLPGGKRDYAAASNSRPGVISISYVPGRIKGERREILLTEHNAPIYAAACKEAERRIARRESAIRAFYARIVR